MKHHRRLSAALITLTLFGASQVAWTATTPPMMPHIQETPLPPAISLPAPSDIPADVPTAPLTAAEAARIALRNQPSITVATAGVTAAQGRLQQAKSGLLPSVVLSGGYSNDAFAWSGPDESNTFSAGANVRQLLFDYQNTRNRVRQSEAQQTSAHANLTRAQSDLVFQTKQAYYSYVQNLRLVSVNETNLRNRREHLALAKARLDAGVGLPIDVVRAETAIAEAILNLNIARNTASVAKVSLTERMGIDPRTPIQVTEADEPAPPSDDFNALLATALQQRPEIAQAQANTQAAQLGVNIAKTSNAPALVGTVGWGVRGSEFPPNDNSLLLGVSVQWNAYDSGLTKGRVAEARANAESAQAQLQSTVNTVSADVSQAYLNVKTAEQRVVTAEAGVANAEEGLRLAQGRYSAGLGVFLDVLDAQATLVTAQTNRVNAQSAVNQARAALAHALNSDPTLTSATAKY